MVFHTCSNAAIGWMGHFHKGSLACEAVVWSILTPIALRSTLEAFCSFLISCPAVRAITANWMLSNSWGTTFTASRADSTSSDIYGWISVKVAIITAVANITRANASWGTGCGCIKKEEYGDKESTLSHRLILMLEL